MHPFVLGELACGNLANQRRGARLLGGLPAALVTATDPEALEFIKQRSLDGPGYRLH